MGRAAEKIIGVTCEQKYSGEGEGEKKRELQCGIKKSCKKILRWRNIEEKKSQWTGVETFSNTARAIFLMSELIFDFFAIV